MRAEQIKYTGFRNIKNCEIPLFEGVNVFFGKNAQGKTNALEGIYMFAHGKSFRTQNDRDLISFGDVVEYIVPNDKSDTTDKHQKYHGNINYRICFKSRKAGKFP